MTDAARGLHTRRAAAAHSASATAVAEAPETPVVYVGLVTRMLAFGVDAGVINLVAAVVTAIFALTFSVLTLPDTLRTVAVAIGGGVYLLWNVGYFVVFWATTGQTPGNRLLRIRVRAAKGGRIPPRRAIVRFIGLILAALPLFAGYFLILIDDRRRGLQDRLARTVVVEAEREERPTRRAQPPRT